MITNQQDIAFTTSDNTRLNGMGFQAKDAHTVLLLVLGLGGNAKSKSVNYFASALAKKGISTIVYSARGHGDSEGLFLFEKNVSDIEELEKKYSLLSKKNKSNFVIIGHSLGGRCLLYANVSSDLIFINPALFRSHPKLVTLPIINRIYLLWWNYFVFRKFSMHHFGTVKFNTKTFKDLVMHTSSQNFPSSKLKGRSLLLTSTLDVVENYSAESVRDEAKVILEKRYVSCDVVSFSGLDHEFSDELRTFMRTHKLSKIVNIIVSFSRNMS